MILTRQTSLIIISALFTISLFSPHLPQSTEQWLSSLLPSQRRQLDQLQRYKLLPHQRQRR